MNFTEIWARSNIFSRLIFILLVLYAIGSAGFLLLIFGFAHFLPAAKNNPQLLIGFAISSFLLAVLISSYHLSTLIRRRKRRTDRLDNRTNF